MASLGEQALTRFPSHEYDYRLKGARAAAELIEVALGG